MSPSAIKNLTYLAVALCVVALVFLVYKSLVHKSSLEPAISDNMNTETIINEDGLYGEDTIDILSDGSSTELGAASEDQISGNEITEGDIVTGTPPSSVNNGKTTTGKAQKGIAEISLDEEEINDPPANTKPPVAKPAKPTTKPSTAATAPSLYVVAGSFNNKDGAEKVVASLKKQGFSKAEVVKSGDKYWASAGKFIQRKDADALIKQLKVKNVTAIVRTK